MDTCFNIFDRQRNIILGMQRQIGKVTYTLNSKGNIKGLTVDNGLAHIQRFQLC